MTALDDEITLALRNAAFNAGLEQAAAWHDSEAARTKHARKVAIHQISAAAIRSMKRGENSNG